MKLEKGKKGVAVNILLERGTEGYSEGWTTLYRHMG